MATKSNSFRDAPKVLVDALLRMEWLRRWAWDYLRRDPARFPLGNNSEVAAQVPANELLVAALSLGATAKFPFRMKSRYYTGFTGKGAQKNYHPNEVVLPGAWMAEERIALNATRGQFPAGREGDKLFSKHAQETLKKAAKGAIPGTPPDILELILRHGDLVTMIGPDVQKFFEVSLTFFRPKM